jgi:hypothetical protein
VAGLIIIDPHRKEIGFSTGDEVAVGAYNDIENDALYFTDGSTIYEWESDSGNQQIYTWLSSKIRMKNPVNIGGAIVEADSYDDVVFKLYAEIGGSMTLKASITVADGEPFRLPGGYLANSYEFSLVGTDVITRVSVGESIWDLAEG